MTFFMSSLALLRVSALTDLDMFPDFFKQFSYNLYLYTIYSVCLYIDYSEITSQVQNVKRQLLKPQKPSNIRDRK